MEQGRQLYVGRNIEVRSHNHSCFGKATLITYSECVSVALVMQHTKRMRRIISLSVACLDLQYFSTLSHKLYDFLIKKVTDHKKSVWFFSTSAIDVSDSKKNSARYCHKCR